MTATATPRRSRCGVRESARGCGTASLDHQPFPRAGLLARNHNRARAALRRAVGRGEATVYSYVVSTVGRDEGWFVQRGSGPNWQGDRLTLATCKHFLRTFLAPDDWRGVWLAGFCGTGAGGGRNALVYLARVAHAFASQADAWASPALPQRTKAAKAAHRHPFGDLFAPARPGDPLDPATYRRPCAGHAHESWDGWHGDIDYVGHNGRPAAILVGDPALTFLWDRPVLYRAEPLGRGQRKDTLDGLLTILCDG
jgi:hypothetical protein